MRTSFSARLIFSVVIIEVIMLGLLIWNSVRLINKNHLEILESTARQQSVLLASAVAPGLVAYDVAMIEDILSLLKEENSALYVDVYDVTGNKVATIGNYERNDYEMTVNGIEIMQDGVLHIGRRITFQNQFIGDLRVGYSSVKLENIISEIKWQNTLIALVTLGLMVLATITISVLLTNRLRHLRKGVQEIEQGNLNYKIQLPKTDEFGELAFAFNGMANHLESVQIQLKREHLEYQRQSAHLTSLLNSVDAVIWESGAEIEKLGFVSKEAEKLLGYPIADWYEPGFIFKHIFIDDRTLFAKSLNKLERRHNQISVDVRFVDAANKPVWTRFIAGSEYDEIYKKIMMRGIIIDINEEKRREQQIIYLAEHDALTGLVNRRHFQDRLNHHIAYGSRYGHDSALLFIDIDQFKYINDTYGHQAGDAYLLQISERLNQAIRDTDILGRLGGDEFGIILPFAQRAEAEMVAANLLKVLAEKEWLYEDSKVHISASIGVTLFPNGDKNSSQLLAEADAAMYTAKAMGRNRFHVFSEGDSNMEKMQEKVYIENMIRDALAHDRFILKFQPIFKLDTKEISHFEALVRIQDEQGGLIMPGQFISTAERFGLINEIDRWVIREAIGVIEDSISRGQSIDLAVNMSGRHIDDAKFNAWLKELLIDNRQVVKHLIIEVTETEAVKNIVTAKEFIESMRALGCRFALDDFGVGFSSFHYLKNLPIDYIKIDGSFVRNLDSQDEDRVFVKATVDIAKSLGILTIAEFVENGHIMEILNELGTDYGQGYFLGRPDDLKLL
ncbi:MAG TPA: EAL domain-containing protein [Gammaproteobacteria bacterium]